MNVRWYIDSITGNRLSRVYGSLTPITRDLCTVASAKDTEIVMRKLRELEKIIKRSAIVFIVRTVAFILLSISAISAIVGNIVFIEQAVKLISTISGIVGSVILLGVITICQNLITIYTTDAQLIASYIIALEMKYTARKASRKKNDPAARFLTLH